MFKYLLSLFVITFSTICFASTELKVDEFAGLPILHEGRVKPLDSFARIELLKFSKKENLNDMEAITWLANAIFDPAFAIKEKIFLIEDAETRHILGLEERKKPFYSYAELLPGLEKTAPLVEQFMRSDKATDISAKNLLTVHENALEFTHVLRSFSSVLPLNIELNKEWRKKADLSPTAPITFSALQKISPEVEDKVRAVIRKKGENPATYNKEDQQIVTLGWQLKTIADAGQKNNLFRVIPIADADQYASPWELINNGKGSPSTEIYLQKWVDLADAWQNKNNIKWNETIADLQAMQYASQGRLSAEVIYNQFSPFHIALILYAVALCFTFASLTSVKTILSQCAYGFLCLAIMVQGTAIGLRIYLMERPPVGTLYESILFVGLIAPLVSLLVERRLKNGIGVLSGAVSGVMLGLLAMSLVGEGDNMKMLGAVLNTRFWLATHVLCITIGYGWCLLTSILAHIILVGKAFKKITNDVSAELLKTIKTHALFSLLFTTVGTILGGIWADQSWGRFWGWDPKENGALLIVVWLIWLIHGRIAGQISQLLWVAGMAFLSVVVALAWVGVNLLGVGLHSYGFIDGVFWGLGIFAVLELMLIGFLFFKIRSEERG